MLCIAVADPECARGGGVSQILPEKNYLKNARKCNIFTNKGGGGPTPATPYAGSANVLWNDISLNGIICGHIGVNH